MKNDLRAAILALALSGAAALGHQLLWTRRMTDLLGAGPQASARVVGTFFLGLALGAAIAASLLSHVTQRWRLAAATEFASAVLCLPIVFLPSLSDWLWQELGPDNFGSWQVSLVRLGISLAVMLPPAMAIGMSLPMIVGAVRPQGKTDSGNSLQLYAVYTAGSAVGLGFVVVVALQKLGSPGAMGAMLALNLLAATVCWYRGMANERPSSTLRNRTHDANDSRPASQSIPRSILLAAFFSGGGIVAVEVLSIELVNLTSPLAFYPQSAILFSAVVLLAAAAGVASKFVPRLSCPSRMIPWILSLSAVLITLIPLIFVHGISSRVALGYADSLGGFAFQMLGAGVGILGAPLLAAGLCFPILMVLSSAEIPSRLAWLLAVNGIGGLVGAELAVALLLPIQGVHVALGLVGCLYAMAALLWALGVANHGRGVRLVPPIGALVICGLLIGGGVSELPVFIEAPAFHVLDVSSSREGSLAIVERKGMGRGMVFDNQYLLGSSGGKPDMQRQAHIPLLLNPEPRRVLFLGLGTGITGSGALQHETVESITSVEISPLVAHAARRYFPELNDEFCVHPKVRVIVDDARAVVLSAVAQFDVIVGDLFTPWRPGESRLCALEHFHAARRALRPRGVFCQWFPMHQLTPEQFDIIVATFRRAFPRTYVFRNHLKTRSVPLALIGFTEGELDWEVVRTRVQAEAARGRVRDPLCRHVEGMAMLCLGEITGRDVGKGYNSLANLRIELEAGRNLILKGYDRFMTGDSRFWADFVESQIASLQQGTVLPEPFRRLPSIGPLVGRYDDALRRGDASAERLRLSILDSLPWEIRTDTNADWSLCSGELPMEP